VGALRQRYPAERRFETDARLAPMGVAKLLASQPMTGHGDAETFREAIIGASLELGQAYGEDGVTMRAIASKLGTSATTLYTCFESKAAIMRELRLRGVMSLGRSMLDAFEVPDPRQCLLELSRRYVAFARENPWLYTVLFIEETPVTEIVTPAQAEVLAGLEVAITKRFSERFFDLTHRHPTDPHRMVVRWWMSVHGLASLIITRRIKADHRYLPVGDVDDFVEESILGVIEALTSKLD
jgi:AcrR family transcriptional regulator